MIIIILIRLRILLAIFNYNNWNINQNNSNMNKSNSNILFYDINNVSVPMSNCDASNISHNNSVRINLV